ncbi:hypothetical protein CS006_03400 [Bifidobacterium primatium]|uniref:DNA-binding protein n=1 Tax=Bifidobacterium primatium TaxID=2045438 RepID=A0A2M9HC14_9BIFI|nr:hypothetical protein CS006_03400 [Bifidobacterium primatium]
MNIKEFCEYVPGMTRALAAQLRYTGKGPKFIKPSSKLVIYRRSDVDDWLAANEHISTAELR